MIHINEYETLEIVKDDKKNTVYIKYDNEATTHINVAEISLNKTNVDKLINELVDIHVEMEKDNG